MRVQTQPSGPASDSSILNKQEAFAAVLLATVSADGRITADEVRSCNNVINRMQLYREQSAAEFSAMLNRLTGVLKQKGQASLLSQATRSLPMELRETAFTVAADLAFSDGILQEEGRQVLNGIQRSLQVSDELASQILKVMEIKNRG